MLITNLFKGVKFELSPPLNQDQNLESELRFPDYKVLFLLEMEHKALIIAPGCCPGK